MSETFDRAQLRVELERDERRCIHKYRDTAGHWTIGVGWNLDANPIPPGILTKLGPDWCIEDGLPEWAIDELLSIGIDRACADITEICRSYEFDWKELDPPRQRALLNMAFNMGRPVLRGFHKMFTALSEYVNGDTDSALDRAAREMLDSLWAKQVKGRAVRLAAMIMPHRD